VPNANAALSFLGRENAMRSNGQQNLEIVMIDFLGALRRGDFDAAAGLLDSSVVWHGLREEWACRGREEVIDTFRWGLHEHRDVDALEFLRAGDRVVMGARGPTLTEIGDEPLDGQIFNVFAVRDGRIVRIDDYRHRVEALSAAGIAADPGWR
jgi:ketosteroid isomerase-like protein